MRSSFLIASASVVFATLMPTASLTQAAATQRWFVQLAAPGDSFKLPSGRKGCTGDGQVAEAFRFPNEGASVSLRLADPQTSGCGNEVAEIVRLPTEAELAEVALGTEVTQSGRVLKVHVLSRALARSSALRAVLQVVPQGMASPGPTPEADCRGDICSFALPLTEAPSRRVRLDAVVHSGNVYDSEGAPTVGRVALALGHPLKRWLAGPELEVDPSAKRATFRINLGQMNAGQPLEQGRVGLTLPFLGALLPEGGARLVLSCSEPKPASPCAALAPSIDGQASALLVVDDPVQLKKLQAAALARNAAISVPLTDIELVERIDGTPVERFEIRPEFERCGYTIEQLTVAGAELEHADVLFSVRRTPESCPALLVTRVVDGSAPTEIERVQSEAGGHAVRVTFRKIGAVGAKIALDFANQASDPPSDDRTKSLRIDAMPSFVPDAVWLSSPLVANGNTRTGGAYPVAHLNFSKSLVGGEPFADPAFPDPTKPQDGTLDITGRNALAVGRPNWLVFEVGTEPWSQRWTIESGSTRLLPCDPITAQSPPEAPPASALPVCMKPTVPSAGALKLRSILAGKAHELLLPSASGATGLPPELTSITLSAGERQVSLTLPAARHDIAIDLATKLSLQCGSDRAPIFSEAAVVPMKTTEMKTCRLTFQGKPLKALAEQLEPYGRQTLVVTLGRRNPQDAAAKDFTQISTIDLVLDPATPEAEPSFHDLSKVEALDLAGLEELRITITHKKGSAAAEDGLSVPESKFVATLRRTPLMSWGVGNRWWGARTYLTFPLSLALARYPSSGASATKSSETKGRTEKADFGIGLLYVIEPWDFSRNRPIIGGAFGPQLNFGLITTLPYEFKEREIVAPGLSIVAGLGLRVPPSTATPIDAALRLVLWYERALRIPGTRDAFTPSHALLFGVGVNFGALLE